MCVVNDIVFSWCYTEMKSRQILRDTLSYLFFFSKQYRKDRILRASVQAHKRLKTQEGFRYNYSYEARIFNTAEYLANRG